MSDETCRAMAIAQGPGEGDPEVPGRVQVGSITFHDVPVERMITGEESARGDQREVPGERNLPGAGIYELTVGERRKDYAAGEHARGLGPGRGAGWPTPAWAWPNGLGQGSSGPKTPRNSIPGTRRRS